MKAVKKQKAEQYVPRWKRNWPASPKLAYFSQKDFSPVDRWQYCRSLAKKRLPIGAQLKLEWIIFYHTAGKKNLAYTAGYFGITRCTLRKWIKRFNENDLVTLEEHARAPINKRTPVITYKQEIQIKDLRKRYMKLGRKKLKILYQQEYGETISDWKIGRVIRKHTLFPRSVKEKQKLIMRRKISEKIRIHHIKERIEENRNKFGYLWHIDVVIVWWGSQRRCIFTAIEEWSRMAYARVYSTNTAKIAEDFLNRLLFLVDGQVCIMHSDNGSEFAKEFEEACQKLGIQHVFSREHTPKDNPKLEKFNHTIQKEWLDESLIGLDMLEEANRDLTEWLEFYNNVRPHQAIGYMTPFKYIEVHCVVTDRMYATQTTP